jgi:Domain of unknown function (DUF4268)
MVGLRRFLTLGADRDQTTSLGQCCKGFTVHLLGKIFIGHSPGDRLHAHPSPTEYSWIGVTSGTRGLKFNYVVTQDDCGAELYIDRGKDAEEQNKAIFDQLFAHRAEIAQAYALQL